MGRRKSLAEKIRKSPLLDLWLSGLRGSPVSASCAGAGFTEIVLDTGEAFLHKLEREGGEHVFRIDGYLPTSVLREFNAAVKKNGLERIELS